MADSSVRRRSFLRTGASVTALGLAGCLGGPADDAPTDSATAMPTEPEAPPATASATPTARPNPTETAEPTPTAPPSPTPTDAVERTATPTAGGDTPTATASPTASPTLTGTVQAVTVAPGGSLSFSPQSFEIAPGTTVRWVWEAGGHNVKPSATPAGADWAGTPGGEFETYPGGYTYEYTFDVAGTYAYYCAPHRGAGMTGSFTVG